MTLEIEGSLNENMVAQVLLKDTGNPLLLIQAQQALQLGLMFVTTSYRVLMDKAFYMVCADRDIPIDTADEMSREMAQYINILLAVQPDVEDNGSNSGD